MKKLRTMLFGRVTKHAKPGDPEPSSVGTPSLDDGEASTRDEEVGQGGEVGFKPESSAAVVGTIKPRDGHRPGTGRLGADAYAGATRVECRHEELARGQCCPVCGQGNLYMLPAGVEIRIDGNALLRAVRYELEKLRCSACGEIFTAGLPSGVSGEKYSAQARTVLAVSRYSLGGPSYRLEGYQAMLGVPVADAIKQEFE